MEIHHLHNGRRPIQQRGFLALFGDGDGNLWVGTPDGLNRFRMESSKHLLSADGLANDFVRSIYADHSGNLWIGTRGD